MKQSRGGGVLITPDKSYEPVDLKAVALDLCQQAYDQQMRGNYCDAVNLYQRSVEMHPTAEAFTFLGWTYSFLGKLEEAIRACVKAIGIDPEFGNPYNDIGAYLLELGREDDAIFWLERATRATRYECRHYPWYNLGRVHERNGRYEKAICCYRSAVVECPEYIVAQRALMRLLAMLN